MSPNLHWLNLLHSDAVRVSTEPTAGKLLLSPSRGTGDDGLLDPGVLLPKPGHLQNEQPNKVVHKGLSKEDHGAGRRWQEASWMVFWEMRAAVN